MILKANSSNRSPMPKKTKAQKVTDRDKPWAKVKRSNKPYQNETIPKNKLFLIVCEGETEEYYFKSFPVVTAVVKAFGMGMSDIKLVEQAEALKKSDEYKGYEVWCVFDFDKNPDIKDQKQDFNFAIEYALNQGLNVAYSNDVFELWYVLHYKDASAGHLREVYFDFLGNQWGIHYRKIGKTIEFAKTVYRKLEDDPAAAQATAIKRAKRLLEEQKDKTYSEQNPCTTVFELVEALNQYLKK
jgi:predicted DNA-binding WGR domain protein